MLNFDSDTSYLCADVISMKRFRFSVLIFLVEEYVEENEYDDDFELKSSVQAPPSYVGKFQNWTI